MGSRDERLSDVFPPLDNAGVRPRDLHKSESNIQLTFPHHLVDCGELGHTSSSPDQSSPASSLSLPASHWGCTASTSLTMEQGASARNSDLNPTRSVIWKPAPPELAPGCQYDLTELGSHTDPRTLQSVVYNGKGPLTQGTRRPCVTFQPTDTTLGHAHSSSTASPLNQFGIQTAYKRRHYDAGPQLKEKVPSAKQVQHGKNHSRKSATDQQTRDLERGLERNRTAADKCRRKKSERTRDLQWKVGALEGERDSLRSTVDMLKAEALSLKEEVLRHTYCGCGKISQYLDSRLEELS